MSQALSVPPAAVPGLSAAAVPADSAEIPASGQSFDQALAEQLGAGAAPAQAGPAPNPATTTAVVPTEIAAGGKILPPVLPIETADTLPDPLVAALLPVGPDADGVESPLPADTLAAPDLAVAADAPFPVLAAVPAQAVAAPTIAPEVVARDGHSPAAVAKAFAALTGERAGPRQSGLQATGQGLADSTPAEGDAAQFETAVAEFASNATGEPNIRPAVRVDLGSLATQLPEALALSPATSPATGATPAPSAPLTAGVAVPFGDARWGQAVAQQVVWVVNQNVQGAELHLAPPELGALSVRISVDQDQASVSFSSAHAMVREAVEAALPRLRDMLGAQGIVLADVNVSHQHSSHGQSDSGGDGSTPGTAARQREPDVETTAPVRRTVAAGILDVYA